MNELRSNLAFRIVRLALKGFKTSSVTNKTVAMHSLRDIFISLFVAREKMSACKIHIVLYRPVTAASILPTTANISCAARSVRGEDLTQSGVTI